MPVRPSTGDDSALLRKELQEAKADREQIRRLITSIPKPKALVPIDNVIGNAEAFSDTYTADSFGLVFRSWEFTIHDYWPGDGAPTLVEVASGDASFDPSDAGWYQGHAKVDYWVTDAGSIPPYIQIELNPASNSNVDASVVETRPLVTNGSYHFVRAVVPTPHFYHPGPGEGNHFLGVEISHPNTSGVVISTAHVSYIIDRVR